MLNSKLFKNTRKFYKQQYTQMANYLIDEEEFLSRVMPALDKLAAQLFDAGITLDDLTGIKGPFGADLRDMLETYTEGFRIIDSCTDAADYKWHKEKEAAL